jgi:hypothetical protein
MIEQNPVGAALVSTHQIGGFHLFLQTTLITRSRHMIPEGRTDLFPQKGDPWSGADVSSVQQLKRVHCNKHQVHYHHTSLERIHVSIVRATLLKDGLYSELPCVWEFSVIIACTIQRCWVSCSAQRLNQFSFLFSAYAYCACLEVAIDFHYEPWLVTLVDFCGPPPILECHQPMCLWGPPMVATNKSEAHALVAHQRWSNPGPATWSCSSTANDSFMY